jgi:tetratricopeptide (TPR) repeat protein
VWHSCSIGLSRNAGSISQLCSKLDGWPLAIELIAASAWSLTPSQMVESLERRFELLISDQRGIPVRQRSLRAVLEAAVELLDPQSREILPALALFQGGFRAEQAMAVIGPEVITALAALQRQALLQTQETEQGLRFALLETVRDYASTLLENHSAQTWKTAHVCHFLTATHEARKQWDGPHSELALRFFEEERANLIAALSYGTPEQATELLASAWPLWNAYGLAEEGATLLETALIRTPHDPEAWLGLGRLQVTLGRLSEAQLALTRSEEGFTSASPRQPTAIFQRALAARDAGNREQACSAFQRFAEVCADDPWAVQWAERERLQLCGEALPSNELPELGEVLLELGFVAAAQGDLATGRALVGDARASFHQNGDTRLCQIAAERLARIASQQRDALGARRATDEALSLARQHDDPGAIARLMRLQWQNLRIPS